MPQEKQQQPDLSELLDDIDYVNQASKAEIKRLRNQIHSRIATADLSGDIATAIIDEVSGQLGQLAVTVKLTDKTIRSLRSEQNRKSAPATTPDEIDGDRVDLQFGVDQLAGNRNLLPIESTSNGTSYTWSGSDPEIQFNFFLDRSKSLGMRVHLVALIKPEYSKRLKVLIDGTHIKHRFSADKELFVLSCNLPPASRTSQTEIKIVLPATHSPKDLGTSNDHRKLGIAISEVSFGKPQSRFTHLLKRLKLAT